MTQTSANDSDHARQMNDFCRAHWPRLYSLALHRGCDPQMAEDAVQEMFLGLLRRGQISSLVLALPDDQRRNLSLRLCCQIANMKRDGRCQKRGGFAVCISLDDSTSFTIEIADERTLPSRLSSLPEMESIQHALNLLRNEMKPATWNRLAPVLVDGDTEHPRNGAYRVALHRARQRLRHLMAKAR